MSTACMTASTASPNIRTRCDRALRPAGAMTDPRPQFAVFDNAERHRVEIDLGDGVLGIADYTLRPGKIMFTHTKVPAEHEGKGVGTALIRFGLDMARQRGLQVIPICPFFAAYIKNHAEVQDLLDPASRKRLGLD